MTAVFEDSNGVKRNFLWQYDKGQILVVKDLDYEILPEVHFATSAYQDAFVVDGEFDDGVLSALIPDELLLDARKITVYLYLNRSYKGSTVKTLDIFVRPRKKPAQ